MPMRPCLDCGKPGRGSRCERDRLAHDNARYALRGTRQQRGLGAEHERQRAEQLRRVPYCEHCGHTGDEANPLTAEHGVARARGGKVVTRTLCRSDNSSRGARIRR